MNFFIGLCFFLIAVLYSMVGHAGASGYLAIMALFTFSPEIMRPTALILNILVAIVTSIRFYRAGYFSWRLFWPFAVTSVPLAFIGGGLGIAPNLYRLLVGIALLCAAIHLFMRYNSSDNEKTETNLPGIPTSLLIGGVIGFLSGITGVGGGIFLSPILIISHWAEIKQTSAVAAFFILINSISGLLGYIQKGGTFPDNFFVWGIIVLAGGFIGASIGASKINNSVIRAALSFVLVFAGIKMILI